MVGETKVLEIMAGAGWLQKGLTEKGLDVDASDDFSVKRNDNYFIPSEGERIKNVLGITDRMKELQVIPGASVRQQDALEALKQSERKIVVMNWPDPNTELINAILEHCHKTQKMIIHIHPNHESIKHIIPGSRFLVEREARELCSNPQTFIETPEIPLCFIRGQNIKIGFWREIPEWYQTRKDQIRYRLGYNPSSGPMYSPSGYSVIRFFSTLATSIPARRYSTLASRAGALLHRH